MTSTFEDGEFDVTKMSKITGPGHASSAPYDRMIRVGPFRFDYEALVDATWEHDCSHEEAAVILRRQARLSVIQGPKDTIGRTECDECRVPY